MLWLPITLLLVLSSKVNLAGFLDKSIGAESYFDVLALPSVKSNLNNLESNTINLKASDSEIKTQRYTPDWTSLDSRPLPSWYDDAKFGIFIHWGVFSVPAYGSEWFWWYWKGAKKPEFEEFMQRNYAPGFTYADFAPKFTAEFYDPLEWAEIFKNSGAKYIVLTSKHHEGYTLWPSRYSWNWNAMDVGPKRDLVGDLAEAIRNSTDLKFGLYHSLFEWFHPLYQQDEQNNFTTQDFVKLKTIPELYEIVNKYKPSIVWSDGDQGAKDVYWNATDFIAWLYNDSPVKEDVVVNDRWGSGIACHHGGFYTCDDRFNPGKLLPHKWENCLTIDKNSWGYRRNARLSDFLSTHELIKELASTVSCGGNMLLNVGPTHDGIIAPIFEERLRQMGDWLKVNGEAIYSTQPWTHQNDTLTPDVWYTSSKGGKTVYAIFLFWPRWNILNLGAPEVSSRTHISIVGYDGDIDWVVSPPGIQLTLPSKSEMLSDWAWVVQLDNLVN
ncbi:hypothetical protein OUZ56_013419 [Daphnia magna]|uniref:alpha-L-fucosidase n=1 Tax=Daphnia magna TaxID=35525 RepID=A0ABQ9Z6M4_9CRUS|nr:hypothetical protein OUZ56_013419 [Daphnia magna]